MVIELKVLTINLFIFKMSKILCVLTQDEEEFLDQEKTLWNIKLRTIHIFRSITSAELDPHITKKA